MVRAKRITFQPTLKCKDCGNHLPITRSKTALAEMREPWLLADQIRAGLSMGRLHILS
jgi:hypothetical protein